MMKENFRTSIGGQALIEGVMMRGPEVSAMAVRKSSGEIEVESWKNKKTTAWYKKTPFIRGIFNMVDSLSFGYKCLMKSADIAGMDDSEPSSFDKWLSKTTGIDVMTIASVLALVLGLGLALGLFIILPATVVGFFRPLTGSQLVLSFAEGIIKVIIFICYLWLVSRLNDIKRVFQYHGAEHKSIACYEAGEELTVENIRPKSRFHPRCGTSFMFLVLIISILLFSALTWESVVQRVIFKLLLLPVVVGISYEIIKYAGRHDNIFTKIVSYPGLMLQRLTAFEPDDSQIEVAIASLVPTIPSEEGSDKW